MLHFVAEVVRSYYSFGHFTDQAKDATALIVGERRRLDEGAGG
jgi:hypothetical protein